MRKLSIWTPCWRKLSIWYQNRANHHSVFSNFFFCFLFSGFFVIWVGWFYLMQNDLFFLVGFYFLIISIFFLSICRNTCHLKKFMWPWGATNMGSHLRLLSRGWPFLGSTSLRRRRCWFFIFSFFSGKTERGVVLGFIQSTLFGGIRLGCWCFLHEHIINC